LNATFSARRPLSDAAFLKQRMLRVLPPYWVMNGFVLSLLRVQSEIFRWRFRSRACP